MLELSSMAKPAPCAKTLPPLIRKKFAYPWSSGRFASMMSIRPTLLGKRLSRFNRCSWTIMRPTIATNRAGFLAMGQLCCMELFTVESAGTKWWFSTKTEPAISATSLGQQYHVPVCQYIHADPVDRQVVEAFFQAISPVELDVYATAVATQQATAQQITHAHQQHLERLRYEATLAQRQFNRVDPDNRLVASELEKRWESALVELKQAEEAEATRHISPASLLAISPELRMAFQAIGYHLPILWQQGHVRQQHKKALLRALIDKVVVHRLARDQMQARIVWKGGETTTLLIPVPIGTFKDLAGAETMEHIIVERSAAGILDEVIAQELTELGYRSAMGLVLLTWRV